MKAIQILPVIALTLCAPQTWAQSTRRPAVRKPVPMVAPVRDVGSQAERRAADAPSIPPVLGDFRADQPAVVYDVYDLIQDKHTKLELGSEMKATQDVADVLLDVMDQRKRGLKSIEAQRGGKILVTGEPASHEYTRDFLAAQRNCSKDLLLQLTLVEIPTGHLAELGVSGSSVTMNSPKEYQDLLDRFRKSEHVTMVTAPQVNMQARGRASISTLSEVSYVADYVLQIVEPGNVEILDPVIEVIQEGVTIDVRAVPVPGGVVQFDMAVGFSVLQRPIPTVKTRIRSGAGPEVEISMPEVDHINLNSVITLPEGGAALISSAAPTEGKDFVILLQYTQPRSPVNARVQALFTSMRDGSYNQKWFPSLVWEDVPALLKLAQSERVLQRFPTHPLSSQAMSDCLEGVVALWLIEGLQEGGNLPSLNPILLQPAAGLPLTDAIQLEQQKKWLSLAREAYEAWWKANPACTSNGPHALEGSGLAWY